MAVKQRTPKDLVARSQTIALAGGSLLSIAVLAGIYFGSGHLSRFDSPLAAYAAATVFAAFGTGYRYLMWLQKPPTWRYFKVSWRVFLRPARLLRNIAEFVRLLFVNFVLQRFIGERSHSRWLAHLCIAWGCIVAFLITIPLSWGWVQFSPHGDRYVMEFMGAHQFEFDPYGPIGFILFNGLNFSAVFILVGIAIAMHRRLYNRGALAVQSLSNDLIPLFVLFSVAVTGLMLTASYRFMGGANFSFLSLLHAFTVVVLLLYLPFGKLFHIIQRPAQLGVQYYKEAGGAGPQALCARSGLPYQSQMHHDDLVEVMKELGFDFGEHQNVSPEEKRKLIALNQAERLGDIPYVG